MEVRVEAGSEAVKEAQSPELSVSACTRARVAQGRTACRSGHLAWRGLVQGLTPHTPLITAVSCEFSQKLTRAEEKALPCQSLPRLT